MFRIKPLDKSELPIFEQIFHKAKSGIHRERLNKQQRNKVVYLVAWEDEKPVGHVLINWAPSNEGENSDVDDCPEMENLLILDEFRGKGYGTKLILYAEDLARNKGFSKIGLAVGVDNKLAHKLYNQLGYRNCGFKKYSIGDNYTASDGEKIYWQETCVYLIKDLQ